MADSVKNVDGLKLMATRNFNGARSVSLDLTGFDVEVVNKKGVRVASVKLKGRGLEVVDSKDQRSWTRVARAD